MPSTHVVESTPETVRSGYLDPAAKPVAVIASGDTVRYPDTWTHWGNEAKFGMSFADREPLRHRYPHGPYSMLGPVEVAGAQPGDVIEVSITALRTIGWGWNSFPLGVGALPHDFTEPYLHYFTFDDARTVAEYTHGITLPMAPFLGVVAAEPAGADQVSAIVSGSYGGNLVLRDLGVGSHLFLPVAKPGGRVWIGDVHALQGDGVVDQTAIETAAEDLQIRYDLRQRVALRGPLGETGQAWIVIGFAASLDDALVACLRELIGWLSAAAGITGPEAYALASMAVRSGSLVAALDLRVHQAVVEHSGGAVERVPLTPDRPVADVTRQVLAAVAMMAGEVRINPAPQEVPWRVPLDEDYDHARYDSGQVRDYFAAATQAVLALAAFRAPYRGRSTPVNAWWGTFDLAVTMFSGVPADAPSDGFITRNSEDAQKVLAGWWPGDARHPQAAFYA
jgi:acetamidase/formamidase